MARMCVCADRLSLFLNATNKIQKPLGHDKSERLIKVGRERELSISAPALLEGGSSHFCPFREKKQ